MFCHENRRYKKKKKEVSKRNRKNNDRRQIQPKRRKKKRRQKHPHHLRKQHRRSQHKKGPPCQKSQPSSPQKSRNKGIISLSVSSAPHISRGCLPFCSLCGIVFFNHLFVGDGLPGNQQSFVWNQTQYFL